MHRMDASKETILENHFLPRPWTYICGSVWNRVCAHSCGEIVGYTKDTLEPVSGCPFGICLSLLSNKTGKSEEDSRSFFVVLPARYCFGERTNLDLTWQTKRRRKKIPLTLFTRMPSTSRRFWKNRDARSFIQTSASTHTRNVRQITKFYS